jgi:hypothetical protein
VTELSDFLDAEYGLQRGEDAWRDSAASAGAKLAQELGKDAAELRRSLVGDRGLRLVAVKQWLRTARAEKGMLPGAAMVRGFRAVGIFATFGGLLFGLGTARAALSAPGGEPINLWLCLGLMVLVQIGILLAAVVLVLVAKARGRQWIGAFTNLLRWLHRWSWAKRISASEMLQTMPRTLKVERWIWLGLTQRFAVFFNLGVLLMFFQMLLFRELQFGWSTTLMSIEPLHMEALVQALAAPWGWAAPADWVPNAMVIEATQWDPLAGHYHLAGADGRVWWPFVMMNCLVWGLLPRLLLWNWAHNGRRRQLARLDWNHRRLQDLFDVMLPPRIAPRSGTAEGGSGQARTSAAAALSPAEEGLVRIAWGDWPNDWAFAAGGRELDADTELVAELAGLGPASVQVVVEAGEAPDKRFIAFLGRLREQLGREILLHVCPVEVDRHGGLRAPGERDLRIWRRTLAASRDDYVFVSASLPLSKGPGSMDGGRADGA